VNLVLRDNIDTTADGELIDGIYNCSDFLLVIFFICSYNVFDNF